MSFTQMYLCEEEAFEVFMKEYGYRYDHPEDVFEDELRTTNDGLYYLDYQREY